MLEEESEALKSAEEVHELDRMKKQMINHVQNEIKEHDEALQHFLEVKEGGKGGGGQSSRKRQKKKKS